MDYIINFCVPAKFQIFLLGRAINVLFIYKPKISLNYQGYTQKFIYNKT